MLAGIATGFLAALLGWQINLIAIHRGIARGRGATFWVGLGATSGDLLWLSLAFAGASSLLLRHREFWNTLRLLGAGIIALTALKILFHRAQAPAEPKLKGNPSRNFLLGFLVVAGNPALLLLWVGVVGFLLTRLSEPSDFRFHLLFLAGFLAGSLGWFGILSFGILPHIREWTDRRFHWISRIFAAALLIGALFVLF